MLFKMLILFILLVAAVDVQAGELQEWIKAFGMAVVCHEGGHAMSGEDVGYPVEMEFDLGGPHYIANIQPYQPNTQLLLQFNTNDKIVIDWNESLKKGIQPATTYEQTKAAEKRAKAASTEIKKEANVWQQYTDRRVAYIAGAGFVGQQTCESRLKGSLKSKYLITGAAFYKLGYAAYPTSLQPGVAMGDIEAFKGTGSMDLARIALAISGLSDIYRGVYDPDSRWSIGFYRSLKGQPGLQLAFIF